jgi:uncharacterized protein
MAAPYAKPLPAPDHDSAPFWEACRAHELRAQRCNACGAFHWPPATVCSKCQAFDSSWELLPGTGVVSTFVVVHYSAIPAFRDELPYVVADITLDGTDGRVRLMSNVIDCSWEEVKVGMPVRVVFEDATPEVSLPKFRPAS